MNTVSRIGERAISMITMNEIAKKVNVSQATVSRVLNGNTSVNPEVRAKVLACAKKYNYQPNIMAQSLNGSKTYLLGVIVTDISNPFFADIVKVIEREAGKKKYSLMLFNSDYDVDKEKKYLQILSRYNVDGILLVPLEQGIDYDEFRENCHIPLVSITKQMKNMDSVFISHYEVGQKIARHLLSSGYSSFVYVGDENDEKERGYKEELFRQGIDLEQHYFAIRLRETIKLSELLTNWFDKESEADGVGIFAYNDIQAVIVLQVLNELRIEIPRQAALVGCDNTFIGRVVSPTITSVAQPIDEMGRIAIEHMMMCIKRADFNTDNYETSELEARVIIRQSTSGK